MGADGGSIPDRRDLVKTKAKAGLADKALLRERFLLCALSKKPLAKPVVADPLGTLYNKDAVLEYMIDRTKYGDGETICRHIKSMKDLVTLNVMENPAKDEDSSTRAPFVCWLSLKEMTGAIPFVALRSCGCVFSEAALRGIVPNLTKGIGSGATSDAKEGSASPAELVGCPNCGKKFDPTQPKAVLPIYPSEDVRDALLEDLLITRAASKANGKAKKRKAAAGETKEPKGGEAPTTKAARTSTLPSVKAGSNGSSVQDKLADQEKKRLASKAGMSDAVKSMFSKSDPSNKKTDNLAFFGNNYR